MSDAATFGDLVPVWLFSAALMSAFLLVRLGMIKSWFILKPLPGLLSARMIYALLPLGLAFLALGVGGMFAHETVVHKFGLPVFFTLSSVGVLFMIWCPSFLKPPWVQWLEREFGYCIHILVEEARKMNRWEWESRAATRKGLESWIQEILESRKDDIDRAWMNWVREQAFRRAWHGLGAGRGPLESFTISCVPKHREEDYQQYLREKRGEIASLREGARKRWSELNQALHTAVAIFPVGELFTVTDLIRACPEASETEARRVLNRLRAQGVVERTGRGRSARWQRV